MEVRLKADLESKLTRLATERGQNVETFIEEVLLRRVDYDEWFSRQVDEGLAAAERGELIDHEDIVKLVHRRFPC